MRDFTNCLQCGGRFRQNHHTQKFCSKACSKPKVQPRKCQHCYTVFTPPQDDKKYCSLWCYHNRNRALSR